MKILASVYACSPYDGSERAVGWNWVHELSKYHQMTVLTSHVYKMDIERYKKNNPEELNNTDFIYIEVPHSSWHKEYRLERVYYILWQKEAIKVAKCLVQQKKYDLVHHITYVTCILPTFMYKLDIPFLLGPVAGGDLIPDIIKYPMSIENKCFEKVRLLSQKIFTSTQNFKNAVKKADLILTATEDTARLVPSKYQSKVKIFQAAGLQESFFYPEPVREKNQIPQFLMAGRMLYLKGYELGVSAFIKALDSGLKAELTILADTENNPKMIKYKDAILSICGKHIGKEIKVVPKVEYSKMKEFYDKFDILINCSLRDSGCFVVMEAMAREMAVISLDTGGPKVNTTNETAIKINPKSFADLINEFSDAIIDLGLNYEKCANLGKNSREYAMNNFIIQKRTEKMNKFYQKATRK